MSRAVILAAGAGKGESAHRPFAGGRIDLCFWPSSGQRVESIRAFIAGLLKGLLMSSALVLAAGANPSRGRPAGEGPCHRNTETSAYRPFGGGRIDLCFWPGSWALVESSRAFVADLLKGSA